MKKKKRYKRIFKESKEKQRKEEIEKIMSIKHETETWNYIRKGREKKVQIDESITVDE